MDQLLDKKLDNFEVKVKVNVLKEIQKITDPIEPKTTNLKPT